MTKRIWNEQSKKKRSDQWKGKTWSPETTFQKGHKAPKTAFKKGMVPWNKGKKHSELSIKKMSEVKIGKYANENHWNWKGGISSINSKIRSSLEYKLWHKAILKRDNFTCRFCGERGGKLQVDHIKPFAFYPELRFAIDNGRTLCESCHKTTDTYKGRAKKELYG